MSTERGLNITWGHVIGLISTFLVPGIGLIVTIVIFATKLTDKVDSISAKVDGISLRQDKTDDKVDHISTRMDTVEKRQLQYHYENKIYQAKQERK